MNTEIDVKRATLYLTQYCAAKMVDWSFANPVRVSVDSMIEYQGAHLLQMIKDVLVQRELLAEYPATWWDAVKLRWFPQWALNRWPAAMNRIDGLILYPKIALPRSLPRTMKLEVYLHNPDWPKSYSS